MKDLKISDGGVIDHYYESDGFWDGKDESLDGKLDLEYCKKQMIRYVVKNDLDINEDWDDISDEGYAILHAEYLLVEKVHCPKDVEPKYILLRGKKYNNVFWTTFNPDTDYSDSFVLHQCDDEKKMVKKWEEAYFRISDNNF